MSSSDCWIICQSGFATAWLFQGTECLVVMDMADCWQRQILGGLARKTRKHKGCFWCTANISVSGKESGKSYCVLVPLLGEKKLNSTKSHIYLILITIMLPFLSSVNWELVAYPREEDLLKVPMLLWIKILLWVLPKTVLPPPLKFSPREHLDLCPGRGSSCIGLQAGHGPRIQTQVSIKVTLCWEGGPWPRLYLCRHRAGSCLDKPMSSEFCNVFPWWIIL